MTTQKILNNNIAGIDYSTTSPAICIKVQDNWDIHFLTSKKTVVDEYWHSPFLFFGHTLPKIDVPIARYRYISSWAVDVIESYDVCAVLLEDYAYAATTYRNEQQIPVIRISGENLKTRITVMIQKRTITLGSAQPFNSK